MNRLVVLVHLAIALPLGSVEAFGQALVLKGLDPVELARGKETPGREDLTTDHGRYRYRFASLENRREFEANPEARAVQFGGACGRMGPFSGTGNPERFLVHDGRIYLFASEGCRLSFQAAPELHIERPNPVPTKSREQLAEGARLLEKALKGFGGAARVDAAANLEEVVKQVYKQGDKEYVSTRRSTYAFPDRYRTEEKFTTPYGFVVRGDGGFHIEGSVTRPFEPGLREIARRQALRRPFAMLRNRAAKGFVAVAVGRGEVDGRPVERLAAALDGATSIWSIDDESGRILQVEYSARRGIVGEHVVKYADFRETGGLVLPYRRELSFNGKRVASPEETVERIVVNGELEPGLFGSPK